MAFAKNSEQEFLNPICSNINGLKMELQKSDEVLKEFQSCKEQLKKHLESTTVSISQLRNKISKLEGERHEWKQRESEVKDDIERFSKFIQQSKETIEEKAAIMFAEDEAFVSLLDTYEKTCRNFVSMLKTLQSEEGNQNPTTKGEIENLEEEVALLENSEKKLWECKHGQLPIDEAAWLIEKLQMEIEEMQEFYLA